MNNQQSQYFDFIFLGAGCASLSLITRMIDSGKFSDKKILLIDKEKKVKNDRTWCFWEIEESYFENLIYKKWNDLVFKSDSTTIDLDISPYEYKMIRGIDFYKFVFEKISKQSNITLKYDTINVIEGHGSVDIKMGTESINIGNAIIFNSIYNPTENKNHFNLLQHFTGWIIETPLNYFDKAILMDFSISQKQGTSFIYLLPISPTKALIEFTLFTKNILEKSDYEKALKEYIGSIGITEYKILETEFGIIPMTNSKFKFYNNGMYHIGTAGGQTKASTGYTFKFIQQHSEQILKDLISFGKPSTNSGTSKKFNFYDSTLLHILANEKLEGKEVFTQLFLKNKASKVFKFLDNETNIQEDLKIINSLPKKEFFKAGIKELFKMIRS